VKNYPLLDLAVSSPAVELRFATDDLLDELAEVVRAGKTHAQPAPYDDPMSFYEEDPGVRVARWLRAIWRRRGMVDEHMWRLYFIAVVEGKAVGLGASEAGSDAFVDNEPSNAVSRTLGYEPNGTDWATRQGERAQLQRWKLTRQVWQASRRDDNLIHGIEAARTLLPLG
jgi:hypothetical protein